MSHRNSLKPTASERTKYRYRVRNNIMMEEDEVRLKTYQTNKDKIQFKRMTGLTSI